MAALGLLPLLLAMRVLPATVPLLVPLLQALPLPPELAQEPELARSRMLEPELAQVHRMLRCPQPPGPQSRRSRMRHRAVRGFESQAKKYASPVATVGRSPPKPFFMRAPIWGR